MITIRPVGMKRSASDGAHDAVSSGSVRVHPLLLVHEAVNHLGVTFRSSGVKPQTILLLLLGYLKGLITF